MTFSLFVVSSKQEQYRCVRYGFALENQTLDFEISKPDYGEQKKNDQLLSVEIFEC